MNARFRGGFIAVLQRIPGFQKFCGSRFRGTNINASRYPNGESICLALNHQTYINKNNKKSDRIVKNADDFNDEEINGTDYESNQILKQFFCLPSNFKYRRFSCFFSLNFF